MKEDDVQNVSKEVGTYFLQQLGKLRSVNRAIILPLHAIYSIYMIFLYLGSLSMSICYDSYELISF